MSENGICRLIKLPSQLFACVTLVVLAVGSFTPRQVRSQALPPGDGTTNTLNSESRIKAQATACHSSLWRIVTSPRHIA